MPSTMTWLATVIRVAIAPVLLGGFALVAASQRSASDQAAAVGLLLLSAIHILYWWRPWRTSERQAIAALAGMIVINFVLLDLLGLAEPLLWLYPALIAGAGLRTPMAVVAIGLTALAAAAPIALEGKLIHPVDPVHPAQSLGPSHSVLLSIVLAGLGMNAVRRLIAVNVDLHATRAEVAELAVAADRERLARELHDLLARTLSLIAVKAELASRLSAKGDKSATAELADVQRLARQAVRDVRDAITGANAPSLRGELDAARVALSTAGVEAHVDWTSNAVDPAHETTIAWALREAVTNVVKHSGARTCRITLTAANGSTMLEVDDDGRGQAGAVFGTGLDGLADRVRAVGGTFETESTGRRGFSVRVRLDGPALARGSVR